MDEGFLSGLLHQLGTQLVHLSLHNVTMTQEQVDEIVAYYPALEVLTVGPQWHGGRVSETCRKLGHSLRRTKKLERLCVHRYDEHIVSSRSGGDFSLEDLKEHDLYTIIEPCPHSLVRLEVPTVNGTWNRWVR